MGTTSGTTTSPPTMPSGNPPKKGTSRSTVAIVIAVVIILAALGGGVYYYESQKSSSSSSNTFTVAVVGPLTGALGPAGTPWADGVTVWANAMNAQGGVLYQGKMMKVSVTMMDDQSNPAQAVQLVQMRSAGTTWTCS